MSHNETQEPPLAFDGDQAEHSWKIALILREVLAGKTNNTHELTLTADATTTTFTGDRISMDTVLLLSPASATAAAAIASGTVWSESHKGEIIVHHNSTSDTDRTFGIVFVG